MNRLAVLCLAFVLTSLSQTGGAQAYVMSVDSIQRHISVLADDSLEGRRVGEFGEWKAAQYITAVFTSAGLIPYSGSGSYLQQFEFVKGVDFGPANRLALNGQELKLGDEFVPMAQSSSGSFEFTDVIDVEYGIRADSADGNYDDYAGKNTAGKAVLIKRYAPSSQDNPHVNFDKYSSLSGKIQAAVDHKATGILFFTPEDRDDTLETGPGNVYPRDIPVIFLKRSGLQRLGLNLSTPQILSAVGETEVLKVPDTGFNVVGYLPGKSETTIVIGAHYDHLGWGGPASRYRGEQRMIHNGADDNASGTAAMLELARYFADRKDDLKYSHIYVAFSGEEAGILGSSFVVKQEATGSAAIRMMVNLDMIGRLKDQENGLAVFGTGTSPRFKEYFDTLTQPEIKMTFREPGTGPSDQTAFYNQGIPSLHFFTGAHEDYHKPTDDVDKIDFPGTAKVAKLVARVVSDFDRFPEELPFQRTAGGETRARASYSVTLGIMPDYVAQVKGLRVDGVTPDRPGEKAGIQKGDVIIRMGAIEIRDIYDYMNGLSRFRKGDSTIVVVQRGPDTLSLPVQF
ncbi:MAG TPA: M28 family peptidase [Candidatus Deferrimicrobium sp.]|nr:M28 family peptidase [Candidatus Deferrimicrobium sp.]